MKHYVPFRRAKHFFCPYLASEEKLEFRFIYISAALAQRRMYSECLSVTLAPAAAVEAHREKVRPLCMQEQTYAASLEKCKLSQKSSNQIY